MDAIIGFCNIRHFMEATEVLKEKVMLFARGSNVFEMSSKSLRTLQKTQKSQEKSRKVEESPRNLFAFLSLEVNQVGEIVHGCVDDFHGAPNRNIGDAFLVIWRLSGSHDKQTKLADMALMSYDGTPKRFFQSKSIHSNVYSKFIL